MMPRRITSSASSRPVHWLMGRSLGCSQASACTWQTCSAVICDGRPGRGTSARRSATDRSSGAMPCNPSQRVRQARTVSTLMPNSRAIWLLFLPASAAKIIRPRKASCWLVLGRRTKRSKSFRSRSLKLNGSGLGPRMTGSPAFPGGLTQYTTNRFRPQCTSRVDCQATCDRQNVGRPLAGLLFPTSE